MIINDTHKFAFVHIPKSAGSTAKQLFRRYDERQGAYSSRVAEHPELGALDFTHLPLFILRGYFPEEYECIKEYESYALVRDPFARFPSSVAQHLRMYGPGPVYTLTPRQIAEHVRHIMGYLWDRQSAGNRLLPPQYIHFQPQADYVYDAERMVVENIYPVEGVNELIADAAMYLGAESLCEEHSMQYRANQDLMYPNKLVGSLVQILGPFAGAVWRALLPRRLRLDGSLPQRIRASVRQRFAAPSATMLDELYLSDEIQSFVKSYYERDEALRKEANNLHCVRTQKYLAKDDAGWSI